MQLTEGRIGIYSPPNYLFRTTSERGNNMLIFKMRQHDNMTVRRNTNV